MERYHMYTEYSCMERYHMYTEYSCMEPLARRGVHVVPCFERSDCLREQSHTKSNEFSSNAKHIFRSSSRQRSLGWVYVSARSCLSAGTSIHNKGQYQTALACLTACESS